MEAKKSPKPGAAVQAGPDVFDINRFGLGVVLFGCLAIGASLFLEFIAGADTAGLKGNTLVRSDGWIAVRYGVLAVLTAALAVHSFRRRKPSVWPIAGGVLTIAFVVFDATHGSNFDFLVKGSDSFTGGNLIGDGDPGSAFYVAGIGGALAVLGGMMLRSSPRLNA